MLLTVELITIDACDLPWCLYNSLKFTNNMQVYQGSAVGGDGEGGGLQLLSLRHG